MSSLALSDSFEYLCYGSTAITNSLVRTVQGSTLDVYKRQILTSKVDPRAVSGNPLKPEFTIVILIHYNPQILSQFSISSGWRWLEPDEKLKQFATYWKNSFM